MNNKNQIFNNMNIHYQNENQNNYINNQNFKDDDFNPFD